MQFLCSNAIYFSSEKLTYNKKKDKITSEKFTYDDVTGPECLTKIKKKDGSYLPILKNGKFESNDLRFLHVGKCTQKMRGYYVNDVAKYLQPINEIIYERSLSLYCDDTKLQVNTVH